MAITIRSVTETIATTNPIQHTTPSGASEAQAGDLAVVIHGNDFYTAATMGTPTAAGTPTMHAIPGAVADGGLNHAHVRAYWYEVNQTGAQTVSVTEGGEALEDKSLAVHILSGADTGDPVDDASNTTSASVSPHVITGVSPSTADALVIIHDNSGGGASVAEYASPGDVVERYDHRVGGLSMVGATKQLAASGATGTFTFTPQASVEFGAVVIAIRTLVQASGLRGNVSGPVPQAAGSASPTPPSSLVGLIS